MTEIWTDDPPHLYAASREGVLAIVVDGGEAQVQPGGLYGTYLHDLATDAKGVLLAAVARDGRVFATADAGKTFTEASGQGDKPRVLAADRGAMYIGKSPAALSKSDDGGKTWRSLESLEGPWSADWRPHQEDDATRISSIVVRGARVIASVCEGGVMVSESAGDAFRTASDGLPVAVLQLAAAPKSDEDLLAGTADGLYRTPKLGTSTWRHVFTPRARAAVTAVSFHPTDASRILIGASRAMHLAKPGIPVGADGALYWSADDGQTWSEAAVGQLRVLRGMIASIVFVPNDPTRVFVGTTAGEIFESRDSGESFAVAAATLPGVHRLAAGPAFY